MQAVVCNNVSKYFVSSEAGPQGRPNHRVRLFAKKPKTAAVDSVSFAIRRGEIFGILGPNGSGKSTLIRVIATLLLPDAGSVSVFGLDVVRQALEVKRLINRVSVEAAFFKKLSGWENLSFAARLYGLDTRRARRRALDILSDLGLAEHKVDSPLEDLSRGMQQKVAVARALLTSPVLLLLDEPTTGLDPKSKREVQDYVLRVREEHDATVLLTSHDMAEVDRLCDRVAILEGGRLAALDTPARLKSAFGEGGTLEDVFFTLTGRELEVS